MLKLGNNNISKLFLGRQEIAKAYLGNYLVWQKGEDNTIKQAMNATGANGSNFTCSFTSFYQNSDFTISFWFKPNVQPMHGAVCNFSGPSQPSGTGVAFGFGDSSTNMETDGYYNNVLFNTISWRGGYYMSSYSGWHHYTYVLTAGTGSNYRMNYAVKQYIDGAFVKSYANNNMYNKMETVDVLGSIDNYSSIKRYCNGQITRFCMRLSTSMTD
jgi:hypothetical protein